MFLAVQTKSAIKNSKVLQANEMLGEQTKNEKTEALIKKFKNEVKRSGKLNELKFHQYFMTKQERKKLKAKFNRLK